jgi:hypothetical protein
MKKIIAIACSIALSATLILGFPASASAAQSLVDQSTITFDGAADGKVLTTRKVTVRAGGGLGVYGKNTNPGILEATWLLFRVYRADGTDVTSQFWPAEGGQYLLNDGGETVNKRVTGISATRDYYIWAQCDFRIWTSFTGCDGTFTVSSWY